MAKKITVNTEGTLYQGKPCDVVKVSRGWIGIIDNTGRGRTVRAGEVSIAADVTVQAAGDAVANAAELAKPEVLIPGVQTQTETNTMATTKRGRRARTTKVKDTTGTRKLGDSEFKNFSKYVRNETASGNVSFDSGDAVAEKLRGLDIGGVYDKAAAALGCSVRSLKDKYGHLNLGMQRMNLSNKMRGALSAKAKAKAA